MEKSRVLQEALHALATEHHELERSISAAGRKSPARYYDTDDDEFYDFDGNEDDDITIEEGQKLSWIRCVCEINEYCGWQ